MFHMANDSGLFRTRADLASAGWKHEGNRFEKDGPRHVASVRGEDDLPVQPQERHVRGSAARKATASVTISV